MEYLSRTITNHKKFSYTLLISVILVSSPINCLANTYTVTNTNNSGSGSLRSAISQANGNPGADTINFNIAGTAPFVIKPLTPLPVVVSPLTIDGSSQPGYVGSPLVELDGVNVSTSTGIEFGAASCTLKALSVHSFNTAVFVNAKTVTLQDNWIGIDSTATKKPNFTAVSTVKSSGTYTANVFSGNTGAAIYVNVGSDLNVFSDNIFGLDPTGVLAIGNSRALDIESDNNTVDKNKISANNTGVAVRFGSDGNIISNNIIISNFSGGGVTVASSSNTITTNVIASNTGPGVYIYPEPGKGAATMNAIVGNKIYGNSGFNIELYEPTGGFYGLDPNDNLDIDTGSNEHQNHPVLTAANNISGSINIVGVLDSAASTTYTIEFFGSPNPNVSVGSVVIGSTMVTTDSAGHASYTFVAGNRLPGSKVVATATDPLGNTSEYSPYVSVDGINGPNDDVTI